MVRKVKERSRWPGLVLLGTLLLLAAAWQAAGWVHGVLGLTVRWLGERLD